MHTNSLIKIISLEIFYFGQGTNHQEFSVSLQRGCRLAPLQSVSNLRNTAEGSKLELFPFFDKSPIFLALCLQDHEYEPEAERKDMSLDFRVYTIPESPKFSKLTKYKMGNFLALTHVCTTHMIRVKCTYTVDGIPAVHISLV